MAPTAKDHGSERDVRAYRSLLPARLDAAVRAAVGLAPDAPLRWTHPDPGGPNHPEPKGVSFLADARLAEAWKTFWPQAGNQPRWDGVAQTDGGEWLLVDAKASHAEFCGSPCTASLDKSLRVEQKLTSRQQIELALAETKRALSVDAHFSWLGSYYQYATRLATLYFLATHAVRARLVFIYFLADTVKNERIWCPDSEADWQTLIEARRLTLGLPRRHRFSGLIHDVFLPAPRAAETSASAPRS